MFDVSGKYLRQFGQGRLEDPCAICSDSDGNILVADTAADCVWIFESKGNFITSIDSNFESESTSGVHALCTDRDNRIFLAGNCDQALQVFRFAP